MLVNKLGLGVPTEQQTEIVEPRDDALQFDAVDEKDRHGDFLLTNVVEERVLQVLHLFTGHCSASCLRQAVVSGVVIPGRPVVLPPCPVTRVRKFNTGDYGTTL